MTLVVTRRIEIAKELLLAYVQGGFARSSAFTNEGAARAAEACLAAADALLGKPEVPLRSYKPGHVHICPCGASIEGCLKDLPCKETITCGPACEVAPAPAIVSTPAPHGCHYGEGEVVRSVAVGSAGRCGLRLPCPLHRLNYMLSGCPDCAAFIEAMPF